MPVLVKRSSTPGAAPTSLADGELALNRADGDLYYQNTASTVASVFAIDCGEIVPGGWNLLTASYEQNVSVASDVSAPLSLAFNADGTRMYVVDNGGGKDVNEYSLSAAWDVSTATFVQALGVSTQDNSPSGVAFSSDGTRMFLVGSASDSVNEYSLSTAWDVSTATFVQAFSVAANETAPSAVFFKGDGTRMYVMGVVSDSVSEYSLSVAWDVSTAAFTQSVSIAEKAANPFGLAFKPDGSRMYFCNPRANNIGGDDVNEYSLSTAWDVSTATFVQAFSVFSQSPDPSGLAFKPDGMRMYVLDAVLKTVYEYSLA